jgi:chromosome segregation ATPase
MNGTLWAAIIAAAISAVAGVLTQRSAANAASKTAESSSRSDIEKEAFERAKDFYTDTIDRQDRQITELEQDLASEKHERKTETTQLRSELATATGQITGLKRDLKIAEATIERLSEQR